MAERRSPGWHQWPRDRRNSRDDDRGFRPPQRSKSFYEGERQSIDSYRPFESTRKDVPRSPPPGPRRANSYAAETRRVEGVDAQRPRQDRASTVAEKTAANAQHMPSPTASPSEDNRSADPRRLRVKTSVGTASSEVQSRSARGSVASSPLISNHVINSSEVIPTVVAQKDVEMEDVVSTTGNTFSTPLAKSLMLLGRDAFTATKQAVEKDALEMALKEKTERKQTAESNANPHASQVKYLNLQVKDAEKLFARADSKHTASQAALKFQAETVVTLIDARIDDQVRKQPPKTSNDDFDAVKTKVESLHSDLQSLNTRSNEHNSSNTRIQATIETILKDVNTVKAETAAVVAESHKVSSDYGTFKKDMMASMEAVQNTVSEAKDSSNNQQQLEDILQRVRAENTVLRKELQTVRSTSVSREEFEKFKTELAQTSTTAAPPAMIPLPDVLSSYVDRYNNDVDTLRKELASMKTLLNSVDSRSKATDDRYERLAPTVYETKGAVTSADTRIDTALKQLGILENQAKTPIVQQSPAYPSPPAPAATFLPSKFEKEVQSWMVKTNTQISGLVNDTRANLNAWKGLNMRYNNLTTENLVQQISGVVYPMLPQMQTDHARLKEAFSALQQVVQQQGTAQEQSKALLSAFADGQDSTSEKLAKVYTDVLPRLSELEKQTAERESSSTAGDAIAKLEKARAEFETEIRKLLDDAKNQSNEMLSKVQAETSERIQELTQGQEKKLTAMSGEHAQLSKDVKKLEEDLESQRQRQDSMSLLQVDEAVNDRVHDVEQIIEQHTKRLDSLEATSTDMEAFIDSTTENLKTVAEEQWVQTLFEEHKKAFTDRAERITEDVKEEMIRPINQRIDFVGSRIDMLGGAYLELKPARQSPNPSELTQQGTRLKHVEDNLRTLEATVNSHSESIEALDEDVLKHFQAPKVTQPSRNISAASGSSGQAPKPTLTSPALQSSNPAKASMPYTKPTPSAESKWRPPTAPRAMSDRAIARAGSKHRNESPGRDPRSKKRIKNIPSDTDKFVDLTSDDEVDNDILTAPTNASMLGGHRVTKGPTK